MEFEILLGVMIALISLVGVVVAVYMRKKPAPTQVLLQCGSHPSFESKLQTLEIKVNGLDSQITAISRHVSAIETKIDILLSK